MLSVNPNLQRHSSTHMPFGPRSWMNDSWLTPMNSIWGKRKRFPHLSYSEIHKILCFIEVTCHKDKTYRRS